jgi:hypothetical protein
VQKCILIRNAAGTPTEKHCITVLSNISCDACQMRMVILIYNYLGLYRESRYVLRTISILHKVFCVTEQVLMKDRIIWADHLVRMEEMKYSYKIFVRKAEWKRAHWRPRRKQEDNIKINLKRIICKYAHWICPPSI